MAFSLHELMVCISAGFLTGTLLGMLLRKLTGSEKIRHTAVISAGLAGIFIGVYGMEVRGMVCILFGELLLFAGEYDMATHTVPDYVHILILSVGLIEVQFAPALLGFGLVPLPFLAAALLKEGSIGGADIKLMAACGFVMGARRGYVAMLIGLALAVLFQKAYGKGEEGFALVPYLAAGCLLVMLT